ncbi:hypothetical protein ACFWPH_27155 [Nocardia sp. NPDC058499]|uniref:hypothetical protein n=1 Tax=Nocardia sp. NPDC058499 TaxID=3346530 RepID=UPI00365A9939
MDDAELVAIIELDANSNEDAWTQANWIGKLEACKAAGITDRREVERTPVSWARGGYGLTVTGPDGRAYKSRIVTREMGGPPTNIPLRTLRPGDGDWPALLG